MTGERACKITTCVVMYVIFSDFATRNPERFHIYYDTTSFISLSVGLH